MALHHTNPNRNGNGYGMYINPTTFAAPMYKVNSSSGKRSGSNENNDILPQKSATINSSEYTFDNTNRNRQSKIKNLNKLLPSTRRKTRKFKNVSKKPTEEQDFEINKFKMTKILEFFSIFFEKDTKKDNKKKNTKKYNNKKDEQKINVSVTYNNSTNPNSPVSKNYVLSGDKVDEYKKVICNYFKKEKENKDETTLINELLQSLAGYDEKLHTKTHNNKTKKFSAMNIEFKQLKKKLFENLKDIFTEKHITFKNLNSLEKLNVDNVNLNESAQAHFTLKPDLLYSTDVEVEV